jgi:hypothetical protein
VKTDRRVRASDAIGAGGSAADDETTPTAAQAASIRVVTPAINAAFVHRLLVLLIAHSSLDGSHSPLVAEATRRAMTLGSGDGCAYGGRRGASPMPASVDEGCWPT